MKSRHLSRLWVQTAAFGLAAVAALSPGQAQAQDASDAVKPLVLILLDTSGSMEYESGTTLSPSQEFTVPHCEEPTATAPDFGIGVGNYPKSRLVAAKEVLTGTYENYWCKYDYRTNPDYEDFEYPIPHVRPCSYDVVTGLSNCDEPAQKFDGLLDVKRDDFKFALMTFDSRESLEANAEGMYSYGPDTAFDINLGIRNEVWGEPNDPNVWGTDGWSFSDQHRSVNNRGQLIPPPLADTFNDIRAQNRLMQYEVGTTVGYWGTPLSPMLSDARWFLQNHETVKPFDVNTGLGDPYINCRERVVILITDGRASQGEGVGGYGTTMSAITALKNTPPTPVRVYVVGFNLATPDVSMLADLSPENGGPANGVYIVDSPQDLATALSDIFNIVISDTRSRSNVTFTNATQSMVDQQYQLSAAFQPDPLVSNNQIGYLNQTVYRCSAECGNVGGPSCARDLVRIHDRLNTQTDRTLLTVVAGLVAALDNSLLALATDDTLMAELFDVPQTGQLPKLDPVSIVKTGSSLLDLIINTADDTLGDASDYAVQYEYMKQLIKLIRAEDGSVRQGRKLGGIGYSTPIVQEPPEVGKYPIRSWNQYATTVDQDVKYAPQCRPTMAYVGTHDGQIHAFRIDRRGPSELCKDQAVPVQDEDDMGRELWSIVPQHLLKRSHALASQAIHLMNGQPVVADVLLSRNDPLTANTVNEAAQWRSVLTTGYGNGGTGYIAIDVTHPLEGEDVSVLWELDHESRCYQGNCYAPNTGKTNDFSRLGLTTARPAYGTAFVNGKEIAIVVLPGGDTPESSSNPEAGKVVYVAALSDGRKLAEFSNASGNVVRMDGTPVTLLSPFTGSPTLYSNVPGVVTTRGFIGDAGGRLWRIDMKSSDPDNWRLQLFHDAYAAGGAVDGATLSDRQPVFGAPAVALDGPYGHVAVAYGTGAIDYLAKTPNSRSVVYSVSEVTQVDGTIDVQENWSKVFEPGEKLTGEPTIFAQKAYFTTFVENTLDLCAAGGGRLYGVHFTQHDSTATKKDNTVAAFDDDGDPTTLSVVKFVSTGQSVPYGVQVVERPSCLPDGTAGGGGGLASSTAPQRGALELVVNVAQGDTGSANTIPPGVDASTMGTKTLTHALADSGETLHSSAWGNVLY